MNRSTRSGFTLVELIFVIVIIGVLSAVAVPKFTSLKSNAEASGVLKTANDAISAIPSAYVNAVDMEEKTVASLSELVNLNGKGWSVSASDANISYFTDTGKTIGTDDVIKIELNDNRSVTMTVECTNFKNVETQTKCGKQNGDDNSTVVNIAF